jgi:hypothetical protein
MIFDYILVEFFEKMEFIKIPIDSFPSLNENNSLQPNFNFSSKLLMFYFKLND